MYLLDKFLGAKREHSAGYVTDERRNLAKETSRRR